jgi:hypothetical protein
VPPFVGVGVKLTGLPAQIVVTLAAMDTEGVTMGFTVIVTLLDVAVGATKHVALLVISHVMALLLAKSVLV